MKVFGREIVKLFSLLFLIKIKFNCVKSGIYFALFFREGVLSFLDKFVRTPIRTNYFNPGIVELAWQSKTR